MSTYPVSFCSAEKRQKADIFYFNIEPVKAKHKEGDFATTEFDLVHKVWTVFVIYCNNRWKLLEDSKTDISLLRLYKRNMFSQRH